MLPDRPSDLSAMTRFDAFLDALADDQPTGALLSGLDSDLVTATRRLHTVTIAPGPDIAFARELRRTLLGQKEVIAPQRQRGSVLGVVSALSIPAWIRGRWWPRLELATMVAVFAVLLLIISGDGNPTAWWSTKSPENRNPGLTGPGTSTSNQSASDQTSASAPSNCPTEPITGDEAKNLAGTPAQNLQPTPTARPATGDLGVPADDETAGEVEQAIETWLACLNAGDDWRALPLYSQSYIRNHFLPNQPELFWEPEPPAASATVTPLAPEQWKVLLAVIRVNQVSDTLVAADVILRFPSAVVPDASMLSFQTRLYLVKSGDSWLIDELGLPSNHLRIATVPTVGAKVVVTDSIQLWEQPSNESAVLAQLDPGTTLVVTNPPVAVDGQTWIGARLLKTADSGWVTYDLIEPSSIAEATLTPTSYQIGDKVQTTGPASIHEQPTTSSMSVQTLPVLTVLTLTGPSASNGEERWWPVRMLPDGPTGYILESVLQPFDPNGSISAPTMTPIDERFLNDTLVTTTSDVRMRSEPSTEAKIVATFDEGMVLVVTGGPAEGDGYVWWRLRDNATGNEGWIADDFLGPSDEQSDSGDARVSTGQPPFLIGDQVQTNGVATIYQEPSQSSMSVVTVPDQTIVTLTGPAVWDGTARWWPVEVAHSGQGGYILESSLRPSTPPPTPTVYPSSTRFAVGDAVYVASDRVVMRDRPAFDGTEVTILNRGTLLSILGASVTVQRVVWWPVGDVTTGLTGYVVEEGLTETLSTPTPESQVGFVDTDSLIELSITVDADGLLAGNTAAKDDAIATLQEKLDPYSTCGVGFVQTFGYSTDIAEGVGIASAVNALLWEAFPDMFAHAVFDDFANVGAARGQVEIELYFYRGCAPFDTATPTAQASASPVGSPVAANPATVTPTATAMPTIRPSGQTDDVIIFVIDSSESMGKDPTSGTSKLDLEKETIRRSVAALPDGASVGVIAFNDAPEWVVPVTELAPGSREQIISDVNAITPQGGSYLTPLLLSLTGQPRTEDIPGLTQIVLLAGGSFDDHDMIAYRAVIEGFVHSGQTFSTVAFGDVANAVTMQTLAEYGNGLYRLVATDADIPTLTIEDGVLVAK